MRMDERKLRILQAIIDDYILTAMPVGSRTISKKYIAGLSSATIRNEMSDLEELGYLDQPHTSAGRIPSAKAYRFYVENLLQNTQKLPAEEARQLRVHFDRRATQVEDVIASAAQAISDVTRYTAVVTLPGSKSPKIRRVEIVPITDNTALLLLVTNMGIIKDTVIPVKEQMDADHLHEISNMLSEQLADLSLESLRPKLSEIAEAFHAHRQVLDGVLEAAERGVHDEIHIGGRSNLLHYPEYFDAEKARSVLSLLETRDKLMQLMHTAPQMAFTVRIGNETGMPETSDLSVVSMTYRIGDETTGTIGVIGPTRMQYAKVLPVLDYMGKALGSMIREQAGDQKGKKRMTDATDE